MRSFLSVMVLLVSLSPVPAQDAATTPPANAVYEQAALTTAGDPERGRKLFFDEQRSKCSLCHRVDLHGGSVGPDLTHIGGKFDRAHLIESLLEPSRQIVEGYRTSVLLLEDDRLVMGILKSQDDNKVVLADSNNQLQEVSRKSIVEQRTTDVSIMPEGLALLLTESEFVDLISFLESLQNVPKEMGAGVHGPIALPDGFKVKTIATGLSGAVALEVADDGRVFVCEQGGTLRVIKDDKLLPTPFVSLPVQMQWERGLIGVTVDPNFQENGYVYVCYVAKEPYVHHVVSRFVADGDTARTDSEQILILGDDQSQLGGKVPAGHQGGAIHFGPDGCLYIALGEQTAGTPSQDLSSFLGKILRIGPDGSIPDDNPFVGQVDGKYQAIWAYGLRNPFTFAIDPQNGTLLANDVGGVVEEINRIERGANYGWPAVEHGPTSDPRFVGPIHTYPQASIAGGDFVPESSHWPESYRGKYLFADFVHGWIHAIDPTTAHPVENNDALELARGLRRPVDLRFGPDGGLYVLLRNAWVVDSKFVDGTSSLLKIEYDLR